jgi:hypothetical protein
MSARSRVRRWRCSPILSRTAATPDLLMPTRLAMRLKDRPRRRSVQISAPRVAVVRRFVAVRGGVVDALHGRLSGAA